MLLWRYLWKWPQSEDCGHLEVIDKIDGQGRNRTADTRIFSPCNSIISNTTHQITQTINRSILNDCNYPLATQSRLLLSIETGTQNGTSNLGEYPMPRPRTGSINWNKKRKYWEARLDWTDEIGKEHCRKRRVESKTEGNQLVKQWIRELEEQG